MFARNYRDNITLMGKTRANTVRPYNDAEYILNINDDNAVLDVPAQIIEGQILIPIRTVAEGLGAKVSWEQSTLTVTILI